MVQSPSPNTFHRSASPLRTLFVSRRDGASQQLMSPHAPLEGHRQVGKATTCQEALGLCGRMRPDVLLLDLREPRADDDLTILSTIHERWPRVQMVAVSSPAIPSDLHDLCDTGGIRIVVETEPTRTLAELLEPRLASPQLPLTDSSLSPSTLACPRPRLTLHERQALGWALAGQGNQEIAERLGVNALTARIHVQNALSKIRARTTQAEGREERNSRPSAPPVREHAHPISAALP
jgi:DNA-binding NarL/FixJ family response regulator